MEFRKVLALRGPNIWAGFPVLEAWVDLGDLNDKGTDELPGFNDRLLSWLPSLREHRESVCEGGAAGPLARGVEMGLALADVALELQRLAGTPVGFGKVRPTNEPRVYKLVVRYEEETVGRECLELARQLALAAVNGTPLDVPAHVVQVQDVAHRLCLGPSTRSIVEAAKKRGIPWRRMNTESLIQFGHGVHQRRIRAAETDRTPAMAEAIAQDKQLTRVFLQGAGVPVPVGRPVADAEDAWAAAEEIGVPVVVKPLDGNQGRGVATNLRTREQVLAAYHTAREEGDEVLVEKHAVGHDYRLLVVGGRLVAAARREPAQVVGDGTRTIRELVDLVNQDPRRSDHHATSLSKMYLNAIAVEVLKDQGYTSESVPPAGQTVLIRRNANLSTGGTAIDVTERVHPDVAYWATMAARVVGLDVTGIDVVAQDISRRLEDQGGVIVEVNAAPGLRMHLEPSAGLPRPVGEAIAGLLYPPGADGRIPIVAITGTNGKTTTTRFIAHILKGTGKTVGMTCTDGIYIDDRRVDNGDCSGPKSARNVLLNPTVEMAVFETARGGILREGLGFDRCDVAVVTNIGEGDHLGLADVDTVEQLARVKRCLVDVVSPQGYAVLNATDPHVVAMAAHCQGKVVFFAVDGQHPVIAEHRRTGGRAVFVRHQRLILAEGEREEVLLGLERAPLTHAGKVMFQVENTLAAVAAAWCLGVPAETIATRVECFAANLEMAPGRFNLLEINQATVIIDRGHNTSSLRALIEVMQSLPHQHRTAVYSMDGDRRDCDLIRVGQLLGDSFDRVILYEEPSVRTRPDGEVVRLIREGLATGNRTQEVLDLRGAVRAVDRGLQCAQPGEVVLIQADSSDEMMAFLREYLPRLNARPAREKAGGAAPAPALTGSR